MYAIEFEADVHNNVIQIPIEYKELEDKHIALQRRYATSANNWKSIIDY